MEYEMIILATTQAWTHYGYWGLLGGSFLSALFIPIGADILYVTLLAHGFNPYICLIIATTGGWLGGLVIYAIGYTGNARHIKHLLHIQEKQLIKQKAKIEKYGSLLALLVWIPILGDISNVALGFYHTAPAKTFIFMFIGRMIRFLFWTILYLIYANRLVKFIDKL